MNWSTGDHQHMALALQLAKKGQYTARPNPMVGCVIVKNQLIVGRGWHKKSGSTHAEINALLQAGEQAKGATCYVTLEPCAHTGKTGPCAKALIEAGVSKVIAATQDPNPKVSGQGFQLLRNAGIETNCGLLENQAKQLNRGFNSKFERRRPWVSIKLAMSLDGRTALADGTSQWITGKSARLDVQRLRATKDAIITGIGTLLADNPSLNVRGDGQQKWFSGLEQFEQPTRILFDRKGEAKLSHKIFNDDAEVWLVTQSKQLTEPLRNPKHSNIKLVVQQSLSELLEYCAENDMNEVLIEAGHKLAGEFLKQNLVDEIILYVAPKLMGNRAMGLLNINVLQMSDCPELVLQDIRQFGDDIRLTYQPVSRSSTRTAS